MLADSTEGPQERPQGGPQSFERVVVDLPNTVAIVVTRPLTLPGRMSYRRVSTIGLWQSVVPTPLVGVPAALEMKATAVPDK